MLQRPNVFFCALILLAAVIASSVHTGVIKSLEGRFNSTFNSNDNTFTRYELYKSIIPLVKKFPIVGTGLGTFTDGYPGVKPEAFEGHYDNAHNDWIELWVETGTIGLILAFFAVGIYFFSLIRALKKRSDPYVKGIGVGVLGSSAAIFTHSMVDFNFHIPANSILFAVILGLGFTAIHNQKHRGHETTFVPVRLFRPDKNIKLLLTGIVFIFVILISKEITYRYLAEGYCPTQINSVIEMDKSPSRNRIQKALGYEPGNAGCRIKLIERNNEDKSLTFDRSELKAYTLNSIAELKKAIPFNPTQADHYLLLGAEYFSLSFTSEEDPEENLNFAIKAYENAVFFNPQYYERVFKAAAIWIKFSERSSDFFRRPLYAKKGKELVEKILVIVPHHESEAEKIVPIR
ncbi:MAG: O-antigen ligase family protein [Nitrospinales bacterium]